MSIKNRITLKPLLWIFLAIISAESAQKESKLNYTCDDSGLHFNMSFERPFSGAVYIKGHSADPNCRLSLPVSTLEASFNVPLMACNMYFRPRLDTSPWLKGFIVFQQHPLVPTIDDSSEPFVCVIRKKTNASWSEVVQKASYALSPKVESWMDFELLPGVLSETKSFDTRKYLFLYVNGVEKFNDILVTDCVSHKEPFLVRNASVYQMTNPNGCANTFTETLSPFKIMRNDRDVIRGSYSEINQARIQNLKNGFISCSAVLCKYTCECTKDSRPIGYEIIFTSKFPSREKRSISEVPSSSDRKYQTRNRLMRSTVKALAERLMKYRRQPRLLLNETDFERRVSISENEETTVMYTDDSSIVFDPTEQFLSTEFSTELYTDIEIQKLDTKNEFTVNISTTVIPEFEVEKILTNLVGHPTTADPFPKHTSLEDSFQDNHSIMLIPELELEKKYSLLDQSTTESISKYDTTIEHVEESTQNQEDIISTVNVTTANATVDTGDLGQKVANETTVAEESHVDPSCVPKLKFVVVTTVLSFIVICLVFISCGLVLYLRKEKKKHAIDNFLLYNYF